MIRIDNYELVSTQISPKGAEPYMAAVITFAWSDTQPEGPPGWTGENTRLEWHREGLAMHHPKGTLLFPTNDTGAPGGPLNRKMLTEFIQACGGLFVCAFDDTGNPLASMGFAAKIPNAGP